MKVIMHDLDEQYNESIMVKCDELIHAMGNVYRTYSPQIKNVIDIGICFL